MNCFGVLLSNLKDNRELGASLLDNTSILFGSNLGNANAHHARNLPIFLAGGGYDHGRYVDMKTDEDTPLSNLYLRLLQDVGIETDAFGQSNAALSW